MQAGDCIAGKYRIDGEIGSGSMGVVVAAWHLELEQRLAIKFLYPEFAQTPEGAARFRREARASVRVDSEHVARVIDVGHSGPGPSAPAGVPYIVMEYLNGRDLAKEVAARGHLHLGEALRYVWEATQAVGEAHRQGIIHRDLKPANLFLATRTNGSTCVKVLDFGVSKLRAREGDVMRETSPALLVGSPAYMAPEQLESADNADERSDVWSLGVILFELLTGEVPFHGETVGQLVRAILTGAPPQLSERNPVLVGVDDVDSLLRRCLSQNVAQRFQSAEELQSALERCLRTHASPDGVLRSMSRGEIGTGAAVPPEVVPHGVVTPEVVPSAVVSHGAVGGVAAGAVGGVAAGSGPDTAKRGWTPFIGALVVGACAIGLGTWGGIQLAGRLAVNRSLALQTLPPLTEPFSATSADSTAGAPVVPTSTTEALEPSREASTTAAPPPEQAPPTPAVVGGTVAMLARDSTKGVADLEPGAPSNPTSAAATSDVPARAGLEVSSLDAGGAAPPTGVGQTPLGSPASPGSPAETVSAPPQVTHPAEAAGPRPAGAPLTSPATSAPGAPPTRAPSPPAIPVAPPPAPPPTTAPNPAPVDPKGPTKAAGAPTRPPSRRPGQSPPSAAVPDFGGRE